MLQLKTIVWATYAVALAAGARQPMKPLHGWKTIHVWVGNET